MEKTILIVLDAFRHDYIDANTTPFLHSLIPSSKYYKKLVPSYGFCERTEIMVGLEANDSNYFTAIGYDEINSPYKHIDGMLNLLSKIESYSANFFKRLIRRLLWEYVSRKEFGFASVNIPLDVLTFFSLTEDGKKSIIKYSPKSIINMAPKHGKSVNMTSFTSLDSKMIGSDDDRINNLINQVKESDDSLYFLYISASDHFGHKYGPDSNKFKNELSILDEKLEKLYKLINNDNDMVNWMYVGDHGMTKIESRLDIISTVNSALSDFIFGKDYIYFADSTVFKIWYLSEEKKDEIDKKVISLFSQYEFSSKGTLTTEKDIGLRGDRTYGDVLWLANPGVIISPDFFNNEFKELNGMHGYNPLLSDTCLGMAILKGNRFNSETIDIDSLTCIYKELKTVVSDGNTEQR
ncbi:hypothetical protein VCSRO48_3334 [Vibrio cholerae]|uniref:alkaline phosphatase family protein n=1 Tax=Vibrio cholerae TaxID=666 RepID=UPI0004E3B747|nr:alkaline phosphatase family protein [Vibrio cholerae]KFE11142.1 type I phosphodiesterase / nucleotide pyrophosphatase family protein [Vibrio cholerae]BCN20647.1 putative monosaccharide biosynthesis protein [Vibrio cholerae]GIB79426.1 hypothetical protein VCSRO48_3334 [Vibrio cholerae]